jgi:uncharacterized Zn-finger protein
MPVTRLPEDSMSIPVKPPVSEILTVETPTVACDGGGGALGHPMVYLPFRDSREIVCPYCSRTFRLAEGVKLARGH